MKRLKKILRKNIHRIYVYVKNSIYMHALLYVCRKHERLIVLKCVKEPSISRIYLVKKIKLKGFFMSITEDPSYKMRGIKNILRTALWQLSSRRSGKAAAIAQ